MKLKNLILGAVLLLPMGAYAVTPTKTVTPTSTRTSTVTKTPTQTKTPTPTPTVTNTPTITNTKTVTTSPTITNTPTVTPTPTSTFTSTITPTPFTHSGVEIIKVMAIGVHPKTGNDATQTSVTLTYGDGNQLPDPTISSNGVTMEQVFLEWWDSTAFRQPKQDPNYEISQLTGINGDILTLVRGQNGTTAHTHNTAGDSYTIYLNTFKLFIPSGE